MISVEQILEKSKSLYDFHFGQRPYGCYGALCPTYSLSDLTLEFPVETALSKTDLWKYDLENLTWKPSGGRRGSPYTEACDRNPRGERSAFGRRKGTDISDTGK